MYIFGEASAFGSGSAAFVEGEDLYLEGWEGNAVFSDGTLAASVQLLTPQGEPFGTVSVQAVTELGSPTVEPVDDRSGNTWTRGTVTVADYQFTDVDISVDGFTPILDATTCSGQRTIFDVRSTDPASRVYRDATLDSSPCTIQGIDDAELLLSGQPREPYLEVVMGAQGAQPLKAQGALEPFRSAWSTSLPLIALATGEQVDVLDVTATVSRSGAPVRQRYFEGGFAEMVWLVPYTATYQISRSDGQTFTAQCTAQELRTHITISPQFAAE